MQEARYFCDLFSLTSVLLMSCCLAKDINAHSLFNSWMKLSLLFKLTNTGKTISAISSYKLDAWSQYDNPEEGIFREGDIHQLVQLNKIIMKNKRLLWPNGIVKYYVHSSIVGEPMKFAMLKDAMNIIMAKTCVKFVRIYPNKNGQLPTDSWVNITGHQSGCYSDLGRSAFHPTVLNLDVTKCFRTVGNTMHEILHTLGVYHEHMRPDRDDYVTIVWENIKNGETFNFRILNDNILTYYGLPYDYDSIMHYPMTAFSINKSLPTIIPKNPNVEIGQRNHLSRYDVQKLLIIYNCNAINIENLEEKSLRNLAIYYI